MDNPKFTVFYVTENSRSRRPGIHWEFFDVRDCAKSRAEELNAAGHSTIFRPFDLKKDGGRVSEADSVILA